MFYYIFVLFPVVSYILLFFLRIDVRQRKWLKLFVGTYYILIALFFATRIDGVDYAVYKESFDNGAKLIPDSGYIILEKLFGLVGLHFNFILIILVVLNYYAARNISKIFKVNLLIVASIYFLHLYIIRDLSQFRIALAMSFIFIALNKPQPFKYSLYLIAVSLHASSIVFIVIYEFIESSNKNTFKILLTLMLMLSVFGSYIIDIASNLDDRVDIYLNWDDAGYAQKLDSYGAILLQIMVLMLSYINTKCINSTNSMKLFYIQVFGVFVYIYFSDIAIFSNRFGSVITSLYPVIIAQSISTIYEYNLNSGFRKPLMITRYLVLIILNIMLILKSVTDPVVNDLAFYGFI